MSLSRVDLNQLVHLDVLLRELSVTSAAIHLGITQPAMSNSLKRLRHLFDDPLLVRTSDGMAPTELALALKPKIRDILFRVEQVIQPEKEFDANSERTFRIMASDYAESILIPAVLSEVRRLAPMVTLDILTPSDVIFEDVEQGRVDMAINRFDDIPGSFHQKTIWEDGFSCVLSCHNPLVKYDKGQRVPLSLDEYLQSDHIWVSKTGYGIGVGVNPEDVQRLGWVDEQLMNLGKKRRISVFTRHYQVAVILAKQQDLIATLPRRLAFLAEHDPELVLLPPPFEIPTFELKMAWSPLLHHSAGHIWMRNLVTEVAAQLVSPDGA